MLRKHIRFDLRLFNMAVDMSEAVTVARARVSTLPPPHAHLAEEIESLRLKSAQAVAKGQG